MHFYQNILRILRGIGRYIFKHKLIFGSIFVLFASLVFYYAHGVNGSMSRDQAIYMYSGQQFSKGILPYESVFDHKGPLTSFFVGLIVLVADRFSLDSIYMVRHVFVLVGSLNNALFFFIVAKLTKSIWGGVFANVSFFALYGYTSNVITGPSPKILMLLIIAISFLLVFLQ